MANNNANAPLTPAVLHILLALSVKELHGYGIMKQAHEDSQGKVKMGPGTLYDNLQRLMAASMVREGALPGKDEDPRRRYYSLTSLGRRVLAAEAARLEGVVRKARLLLEMPRPRRSS